MGLRDNLELPHPRKRFKYWECPHCGRKLSRRSKQLYGCLGCDREWRWRGWKGYRERGEPLWAIWGPWRDRTASGRIRE